MRGFTAATGAGFSGHFIINLQQHWADMHTSFLFIASFLLEFVVLGVSVYGQILLDYLFK